MKIKKQASLFFLTILLFVSILFLTNMSAVADGISSDTEQSVIAANASTTPAQNSSRTRTREKRARREPHRTTGKVVPSRMARMFGATNPNYSAGKNVQIPTMAKTIGTTNGVAPTDVYSGDPDRSLDVNIAVPHIGPNGYDELFLDDFEYLVEDFSATVYPYLFHDFHDFLAADVEADLRGNPMPSGVAINGPNGLKNLGRMGSDAYYEALKEYVDPDDDGSYNRDITDVAFGLDAVAVGDSTLDAVFGPDSDSYPIPYAYWKAFMDPANAGKKGAFWYEYPRYYFNVYLPGIARMYKAYYSFTSTWSAGSFKDHLTKLGYYVPNGWGMPGSAETNGTWETNYHAGNTGAINDMVIKQVVVLDTTMPRNIYMTADKTAAFYPDPGGENFDEIVGLGVGLPAERDLTGNGDFASDSDDDIVSKSGASYDLQFLLGRTNVKKLKITGPASVLRWMKDADIQYDHTFFKGSYTADAQDPNKFGLNATHAIANDAYPYLYGSLDTIELNTHNGSYEFFGFYNHDPSAIPLSGNSKTDIKRNIHGSNVKLKINTKDNYDYYQTLTNGPLGNEKGTITQTLGLTFIGYGGTIETTGGDVQEIAEFRIENSLDALGSFQPTRQDILQQFAALKSNNMDKTLTVVIDALTHSEALPTSDTEFDVADITYKIETEPEFLHRLDALVGNGNDPKHVPLPEGVTRLELGEISVAETDRVAPLSVTFKEGNGTSKLNLGARYGSNTFRVDENASYLPFEGFIVSVPDGEITVKNDVMYDRVDINGIGEKITLETYGGKQIFGVMASKFRKNLDDSSAGYVELTPLRFYSEHDDLQLALAYAIDKVQASTHAPNKKGLQVVRLQGDYSKLADDEVYSGSPSNLRVQQGFGQAIAVGYGASASLDEADIADDPSNMGALLTVEARRFGEIVYVDNYEYRNAPLSVQPHIQHLSIAAVSTPSGGSNAPLEAVGVRFSFAKNISVEGISENALSNSSTSGADKTNLRVAVSPVTEELWIVEEYNAGGLNSPTTIEEIKIDTAGENKDVAGSKDLKTVRLLGKYSNASHTSRTRVYDDFSKYDNASSNLAKTVKFNFSVILGKSTGGASTTEQRSGPVSGRWKLLQLPKIEGWDKANMTNAKLALNNNAMTTIDASILNGVNNDVLQDIMILEVQDNKLEIFDMSQVQGVNKLVEVLYRAGNDTSLKYLDFSNMDTLDADRTFNKKGKAPLTTTPPVPLEETAEESATLSALETLKLNNLPQIADATDLTIDYSNNKISLFEMKDADKNLTGSAKTGLVELNLSENELNTIETVAGTPNVPDSEMTLDGSSIDGKLDLSGNILDQAWFDGIEIKHLDVSSQYRDNSPITGLPYVKNGVKVNNAKTAEEITFGGSHIGNLILNNSPNVSKLNGTKNHGNPGPQGIIGGTLGLEGNTGLGAELKLYGHLIEVAELSSAKLADINLSYNNGKGEDAAFEAATLEEKLDPANQGVLRRVDLRAVAGGTPTAITNLNVRFNAIEYIDNQGKAPSPRAVGDPHAIDLKGAVMAPNAGIDADFNNIDGVFLLGLDNLTTLHLTDNLLVTLQASGLKNLRNLYANRTMAGRNLFENGIVDLSNSTALESFAPSTTLAADKAESLKQNRQVPKEPNETRWEITANPALGIYDAEWRQDDYKPTTEFGFYHNVPIKELNVTGAKSLKTLRVAGNRLTNATMKVDASASSLELLDISGAPYLENGENAPRTARTRFGMAITTRQGKQDALSGKITGTFTGVWPNLKTLYVQNNSLSSVQVGSSTQLKHLLAYQNNITKVELMSAPNLEILDIERNLLGALEVPQKMRILRAGENKLPNYPNVANIVTLEQLYLNHNLLRGDAPSIAGNPVLKVLNIAENRYKSFPDIAAHGALEELYAYNNIATSPTRFNPAGKLAIVDLAGNRLNSIAELPNSIVYFDISDNRFVYNLTFPASIPAGFARTTPYSVLAHEVYSRDTTNNGIFTGALAIENNQITSLPTALENAWAQFRAGTVGRPVYNMFVNFNILDIDVYGLRGELDENGQIKRLTGTQKWVAMDPDNLPRLLVSATNSDLYLALLESVKIYNPAIAGTVDSLVPKTRALKAPAGALAAPASAAAYEDPFPGQRFEAGWYGDGWQDFVTNGNNRTIKQTGFALAKMTILHNPGRNGYDISAVHLIDWQTVDTTMDPGQITAPGGTDSGTATDGKKKGKNPNTGGK